MHAILWLVDAILSIAFWVVVIQAVMSWLIGFNVVNLGQPFVHSLWRALNQMTDPVYRPLRRIMPAMGGLDFTPMIVILGIFFLRTFVAQDLAPMLLR